MKIWAPWVLPETGTMAGIARIWQPIHLCLGCMSEMDMCMLDGWTNSSLRTHTNQNQTELPCCLPENIHGWQRHKTCCLDSDFVNLRNKTMQEWSYPQHISIFHSSHAQFPGLHHCRFIPPIQTLLGKTQCKQYWERRQHSTYYLLSVSIKP
jgi:hypothetical protein